MSPPPEPIHDLDHLEKSALALQNARQALRNGDRRAARHYSEQAAAFAPDTEDPWLLLAALASPRASIAYLEQALRANPASKRAKKGLIWAEERLQLSDTKPPERTPPPTPGKPAEINIDHFGEEGVTSNRLVTSAETAPILKRQAISIRTSSSDSRRSFLTIYSYGIATIFLSLTLFAASLIPYYPQIRSSLTMDQLRQLTTFFERSDEEIMLKAAFNLPSELRLFAISTSGTPISSPVISPSPTPSPPILNPSPIDLSVTNTPIPSASYTPEPTEIPDYTDTPIPTETPEATSTSNLEPTLLPSVTLSPPSSTPPPAPTRKAKKKANAGPGYRPAKVSLDDRWVDVDISTPNDLCDAR